MLLSMGISPIVSCDRLIEVANPPNLITADKIFEDSRLLDDAMLNCYRTLDFHEQFLPYLGLYVDELATASLLTPHHEFYTTALTPETNLGNYAVWRTLYSVVYQANFIIEGLEEVGRTSALRDAHRHIMGEAKFVRAYSYFYLVNLWENIPLVLTANVAITSQAVQQEPSAVYLQIVDDLREAEGLLSTMPIQTKSRAGAMAAKALLARVFLYLGDWQNAAMASGEVIRDMPPLTGDLDNLFQEGHAETLFELWKERGYSYGSVFIPASIGNVPTFTVRDGLVHIFDGEDRRLQAYLATNSNGQYFPYKYKQRLASGTREFDILLRLPEAYLINAEARFRLGDKSGGIASLNTLRRRVGLGDLDGEINDGDLMVEVVAERAREYFCEGAHRFLDLKRLGMLDAVMAESKPTWNSSARLFPLPQQEIDRNPLLRQNEGYN